jgi:hypothetical protein
MRRISLFITDPQYKHFQDLGRERDRPVAELVRDALDRYLLMAGPVPLSTARPPKPVTRRRAAKR